MLAAAAAAGAHALVDASSTTDDELGGTLTSLARGTVNAPGLYITPLSLGASPRTLHSCVMKRAIVVLARRWHEERWSNLPGLVHDFRTRGARVLVEVVSQAEADAAIDAGADALVAKGNEAGGRVGSESTFVLLQRLLRLPVPVWSRGGMGPHAAAACIGAGAAGVMIDWTLALAREVNLPESLRRTLAAMDGSETQCLGESLRARYRVLGRPGEATVRRLRQIEVETSGSFAAAMRQAIERGDVEPVGQDAAFAAPLARHHGSVSGILGSYRRAIADAVDDAARAAALQANGPLARAHGTRYAIVQGPMTRVSDVVPFAEAVADAGGLPFMALALLRRQACESLLTETAARLGDRPWGVGILAFVPPELRAEQIEVVLAVKPRFAILAGGRPDQADVLERGGIATYIHVPSPALLERFLRNGARRFIFEGRECGGHVGPLSSFVLWESMVGVLLDFLRTQPRSEAVNVLFAGGIHDARSSMMAQLLAAPLTASGVRIGVLMGTAYLSTREAVESGAITTAFQRQTMACDESVILDADGGHAIRCAPSPYCDQFETLKRELLASGADPVVVRERLEEVHVGRLRVASKGIARVSVPHDRKGRSELVPVSEEQQVREGMYMVGQVAALRHVPTTMPDLHRDVADGSTSLLREAADMRSRARRRPTPPTPPEPIAIIGLSCVVPGASNVDAFWSNVLNGVDAITEVPERRWRSARFYTPDRNAADRVTSKWGGFIEPVPVDPIRFGIPPGSLDATEPIYLLALEVARRALENADCDRRPFPRDRTGIVIASGGGLSERGVAYEVRTMAEHYIAQAANLDPAVTERVLASIRAQVPPVTEDTFPGILPNVAAGRIANRFNLGGPNVSIDAACASSLAALEAGVKELRYGTSDAMLVGSIDGQQSVFQFLLFSRARALSPTGRCRPFDAAADGIAISEGVVMLVLKRLSDAERDGDRIHAVLRGVAGASDGREMSLTAPAVNGQRRAIERAYEGLDFRPSAVSLVEAHGTGTVVGDRTELETLRQVWTANNALPQSTVLGSVKSQIGHTKNTAGLAALVKVIKALHHGVLPPTLFDRPNEAMRDRHLPFYLTRRARPWFARGDAPRRAAVSAFGFGGTNFHAVLEERPQQVRATVDRPAELLVFRAADRAALVAEVEAARRAVTSGRPFRPLDVAAALAARAEMSDGRARLAVVAGPGSDGISHALASALAALSNRTTPNERHLIYGEVGAPPAIALLFPGQGSQRLHMLEEPAIYLPAVRRVFEAADRALEAQLPSPLTQLIFPPPAYEPHEEAAQRDELDQTWFAQPALGAAEYALYALLDSLNVRPTAMVGHSYGEYVALAAAGAFPFETLMRLSERRGRVVQETQGRGEVAMLAVQVGLTELTPILNAAAGVSLAGENAPHQVLIGGATAAVDAFVRRLDERHVSYRRIAMSAGFHIPEAQSAADRFAVALDEVEIHAPRVPVYSNCDAKPYDADSTAIRQTLVAQLTHPLRFRESIEALYNRGVRTFVEVGPGTVLTGLVRQTLGERPASIIALGGGHPTVDFRSLLGAVGALYAQGAIHHLSSIFAEAEPEPLDLAALTEPPDPPSTTTWMVDGGSATPVTGSSSWPPFAGGSNSETMTAQHQVEPPLTSPASDAPATTTGRLAETSAPMAVLQRMQEHFLEYLAESQRQRHQLMSQFLETQQSLIVALTGSGRSSTTAAMANPLPATPSAHPDETKAALAIQETAALATSPATAPVTPPPEPPARDRDTKAMLLALVSRRTGYPTDMLDLDQNLEADLGIDSIKRTEIFGGLLEQIGVARSAYEQEEYFLTLARFTTLRQVLDWLDRQKPADLTASAVSRASAPVALPPELPTQDQDTKATLLALVSRRTGYPTDMLDLDQNLEADLGIDSIKRTEIFGGLLEQIGLARSAYEQEEYFLTLARFTTLRQVLDWVDRQQLGDPVTTSGTADDHSRPYRSTAIPARPVLVGDEMAAPVHRFVVTTQTAASPGAGWNPEGRVLLLTTDSAGIAARLASELRDCGATPVLVRHTGLPVHMPAEFEADLTVPEEVARTIDRIKAQYGRLDAILHLMPLDVPPAGVADRLALRSLFLIARQAGSLLRHGHGLLLAVTGLGGRFGTDRDGGRFSVGAAAVPGLVKSIAQEWVEVRARVVDVDPSGDPRSHAKALLEEILDAGREIEIGRLDGRRVALGIAEGEPPQEAGVAVDPQSVVLVTGGARGIASRIAEAVAAAYGARVILTGRSPVPEAAGEDAEIASLVEADAIKRVLAERRRHRGEVLTPAVVNLDFGAVVRAREMRRTFARLEALGVPWEYHCLDVSDDAAFRALVASIYARHGRLDGVIHAAGIVEDGLLVTKTPGSFDRVFETKVRPALTLAEVLRPESLRFLVFFSSIAGRFGCAGSSDYAAANETLNRLAARLDRQWPGRVVSIAWGPWAETGMATHYSEAFHRERGFASLSPEEGCRRFLDELSRGKDAGAEVVLYAPAPTASVAAETMSVEPA